jgi:S-formylglutathione hydrolase FrmB
MDIVRGIKSGAVLCFVLAALAGCQESPKSTPDHPRLTPQVAMRDVTFHSAALARDMQYRVIMPAMLPVNERLPVVYLLHGGGEDFRSWSNYSDVAGYAERGIVLVMPEGGSSYYTNSVARPADRYEDYLVHDLIADAEARFPIAAVRRSRAIAGVSMGGFGAVKLALKHPELFAFAAGVSSALDVPSRPFSIKRIGQWRHHRSIFGPWGGHAQLDNDPYVLVRSADPSRTPYLFLTCGEQEGLLPANRRFASLLVERKFQYELHVYPGGHNWNQWNKHWPMVFQSLFAHISRDS